MVRFKKRQRTKEVSFVYKGVNGLARYVISPITGNLSVVGMYDSEVMEAFVMKGEKRGTLGGSIVVCDALGRRDNDPFIRCLAAACKFNKYKEN